ncbi:bifunctional DNA-formamidopyrimidine glycosylase/DNA-(apurinic or apyrimidinic site) lyase [Mycoplasma marinum]|uniref:DNA-formamidopyrimidine glycosylase n=1 Tax=Mycoplasma marinum TaxID=1937190 RepID=A0A4R0XK38_9MOLU|nr:bifunctional DNA-formamidopyrimidine glycosylase/DNA-(apurinic or apyrimidinic site) lyase [Mycoplasma marinum]TCG10814.1 DNA-formamidopyrimidine glycosylase [Mycoplasma marinum]
MPEMPEVRTVTKDMNILVEGKTISRVEFPIPKILKDISWEDFEKSIANTKIVKVTNIGKWIVFKLTKSKIILSHLRMTGSYYYFDKKPKELVKHTCSIFIFDDESELHYVDPRKFGTMHLRDEETFLDKKPLLDLGKEPQNTNVDDFLESLKRTSRAIKTVILDQKHVLGFGNIYVDETLWEAKIHPETPAKNINKKQAKLILEIGARIMDHSTRLGGSSIQTYGSVNGKPGEYQNYLKVFGKAKNPCPRCKEILQKTKVNGRGTTTCPNCQRI